MNRNLGKSKPRIMDRLKQDIQARQLTVDGQAHRLEQLNERLERLLDAQEEMQATLDTLHNVVARGCSLDSRLSLYQQTVRRIREFVRRHLPRYAKILVVSKGDPELVKLFARTGWHFPRNADGQYPGYHPACDLSVIAHLEALRVQGAEYFLLPHDYFWWFDHYPAFRQHLEQHYRLVARENDTCAIYSLTETPQTGSPTLPLSAQLARFLADFQARFGRDPIVLDMHTGVGLARMFPQLTIFQPLSQDELLPYVDRSVDVVALPTPDAAQASEAFRVASAGVIQITATNDAPATACVEWLAKPPQSEPPTTSIVIPCHNGRAMTEACLESLWATLPRVFRGEIIVVDDASSDDTAALLKRWRKRDLQVKVIRNRANLGFVKSCNRAARRATGEILVFLNNDVVLLPGWLEPLWRVFRDFPQSGAVGGKLILPDGTLQEAGGVVFNDGSAMNFGRGDTDLNDPLYSFVREVDYCSAALFATRRDLFQQLGGFAEDYSPGYYEDTDYCFKLRANGQRVYFQPDSAGMHREGGTAGTDPTRGMKRHQVINRVTFQKRWTEALKNQPERPAKLDAVTMQSLAWRVNVHDPKRNARRVLVCAAYPPEFDRDSGSRRLLDLIELLVADGWAVSFIAAQRMGDVRYTRTLQQMGVGVFDGAKIRSEDFLATLCFDLALLSVWTVAEIYAPLLRRVSPQTRIVVDSVDLCFLRNARRLLRAPSGNGITSSLDSNYASEFIRELNIYAAADAVLTVSPKEADLVNDMIGDPKLAQVVSDLEASVSSRVALNERRGIVFVGSFRHAPNLDAVEFFCNEIVPLLDPALTARHPIYIIGEGLTDEVRKLADGLPGVRMVGWVPSVKPYLERARVAVAPLRYGAGTKRKLLQMILSGTPAVSSTIGVEGFNLKDGEQVLIADEPEPFAKAITHLLTDDSLWSQLVERGRTHLLTTHSREAVQIQVREVIKGVLAAKPKTDVSETAEKPKPARLDMQSYAAMREKIRSLVELKLPPQARVIVVSRGDDELLKLKGRTAWHFPQNGKGVYAGHHPENGADAVAQLEALRARGGEYLLLPSTQFWWLDHYREFRDLLETNYAQVTREEGVCAIYRLAPQASVSIKAAEATAENGDVSTLLAGRAPAAKLIAFYLPQFHAIPENDAWWGKGFTEWTNVRKAMPQFPGHHQPQVPADLGYYDLQFAEIRRAQADLAREHGIHGFCYYHYWFNGRRLLERPFTEVLASGEPDFPFCLCWANEPWTRRWDGREKHILQPQFYSPQDDLDHIRALLPALADKRAIRVEGRPVFLVYQGRDLPDPARTIEMWRREVERAGLPGIYLMCVETGRDAGWDATQMGFDAKVLFQPQFTTLLTSGAQLPIPGKESLRVFDYQTAWPVLASSTPPAYRHYHTVCPGWDNSPRSGENAVVLHNSSPASYEQWLRSMVAGAQSREPEHRIVFINAWNEWGEGCHLEPDAKHGRAYLQATRRAVLDMASAPDPTEAAKEIAPPPAAKVEDAATAVSTPHEAAYRSMLSSARGTPDDEFVPATAASFGALDTTLKPIAFYLPQFHAIPENDAWWGKGFTEWTNVSKAVPQFSGHYQPHLPGELGFYDLRVPEVQRRQVELAKQYGLRGFCFYYYWFAGKRLLERPLQQFMADPEIDFPFCICWANENWTRRWDGQENEILIAQPHSEENDLAFIRDAEPMLRHKNYLRVQGRPLLVVYRARLLPNAVETAARWRRYCQESGIGDPYLVVAQTFERINPSEIGFDAAVEFPPNTPGNREELNRQVQFLNPEYSGKIYRYDDLMKFTVGHPQPAYELFRTVCPSWDNEARSPGRGSTYALSSPEKYGRWLRDACRLTLRNPDPEKHLVFINAWNEWAEGTHLEPDRRYGYAWLQTTANVIASFARDRVAPPDWTILFVSHDAMRAGAQRVLLNQMSWFKKHTSIRLKLLCLEGGDWLPQFREIAETVVLGELEQRAAARRSDQITGPLLDFCEGIPDLIYANSVASGRIFQRLRPLNAPIITHIHELEKSIQRYAGKWIHDVVGLSSHFIACSEAVRESLIRNERIDPKKISTVFASIRPDAAIQTLSSDQKAALRQRLGLPAHKHLVCGCGVGMPFRKGADLFIRVAHQLRRSRGEDFHFCWIGDFDPAEADAEHGVWSDHLTALARSGDGCVTFLGVKENPREYLSAADVFLLPSREDPFPLAALEAAECGVPIVCFDKAGGMPGFVGCDAGFVVPLGDVPAMARRVNELLKSKKRRHALGDNARTKLLSRFTFEFTAPQILSVCRTVAEKKPAVSVIVPNYNHARFLPERLDSIFNQAYRDFEVILLDDASSDGSMEVLEQYGDRADVRIVRNEGNSGSTFKQWLKGIELARADVLWIAESDDRCEPDFLASLLPAFANPRVKLAYANSHVIDESGTVVGDYTSTDYLRSLSPTKWTRSYTVSAEQEINDGLGVKNTILSASAVLFRKFALTQDVRNRLEGMRIAGDWYFIVHAIAGGEVHYESRNLSHHRRHSESVVGKLLQQNRVNDFFREFYTVHSAIFGRYRLVNGFPMHWEKYLTDQWAAFFPDRPFAELNDYYPIARAREQITAALAQSKP